MAIQAFIRTSIVLSISAFVLMFVAFASPYWYKSWTRVHSSFGSIGLWHVCLNGYIMPKDPIMKSYVGCWWIHSSEFNAIKNDLQPAWFRFIQAFSVFSLFMDLFGAIFTCLYLKDEIRSRLYKNRPRMFFINSALMLGSAFLVFLISLVFAEKANDGDWMPRPWMNYLSWSYGLCVLSGFFAAFAGMCLFILALIFKDKEENGDPGVTSAAELTRKRRELEKQDEAMRVHENAEANYAMRQIPAHMQSQGQVHSSKQQVYQGGSRQQVYQGGSRSRVNQQQQQQPPSNPERRGAGRAPSETGSEATRVGESVV